MAKLVANACFATRRRAGSEVSEQVSINNTWRVVLAVSCLLFNSTVFVALTFYGNPANALHSWAQSATFVAAVGIIACLSGFSAAASLATSLVKK